METYKNLLNARIAGKMITGAAVTREKTVKKEEPIEESFDDLFPSIKREL